MSSPTFNGNKIFDSLGATGTPFSEGVLVVSNYSAISQKIHFEGEVGDWTLWHGYPDLEWSFDGILSATTSSAFGGIIQGIQSAIDDAQAGNYHTLVDSFGSYYDNSQVRAFHYTDGPRVWVWNNAGTLAFGYLARVKITGICQNGSTHVGAVS
jgi:hypothetical protein